LIVLLSLAFASAVRDNSDGTRIEMSEAKAQVATFDKAMKDGVEVMVDAGEAVLKSNRTGDVDGLCHCMNRQDYNKVDWDVVDHFDSETRCWRKCGKKCKRRDKDIYNYPFFECREKDDEYECDCIDFEQTAREMGVPSRNYVYGKVFMRWNFHDNDAGDSLYFERKDDIKDCMADCDDECRDAHAAIDEHGVPFNPEGLKGVCTVSKFDIDD